MSGLRTIINSKTVDVNKLYPYKYGWSKEYLDNERNNNWMPEEVPLQKDSEQWKSNLLTENERLMFLRNLGFFSSAESLVSNNLVLSIFKFVTEPMVRAFLIRQAYTEVEHTLTFSYITETLDIDSDYVFNMYNEIPSIKAKADFEMKYTEAILQPGFNTDTDKGIKDFLTNLIAYYICLEGIMFYSGFAMILSLKRRNMMPGVGSLYELIMRDEVQHLGFGANLINTIISENKHVWTQSYQQSIYDMIDESVALEIAYAKDTLPNGIIGLNHGMFEQYIKYIADRRLERINLNKKYFTKNPFPWLSEAMDIKKEKNFFETKATEYQSAASLEW